MSLVSLSESDLAGVETLFTQFHQNYACFYQMQTRSDATFYLQFPYGTVQNC